MSLTSSISKTSIRPVVQLNTVRPRMFSKKLVPIVQKESFWNKKSVITKPKKPFTKPEFKVQDKLEPKKFSMNIFSNEKKTTDKKESNKPNKSSIILPSQFYINEDQNTQRNRALKIFLITFSLIATCALLLTLLLFKDISAISKTI